MQRVTGWPTGKRTLALCGERVTIASSAGRGEMAPMDNSTALARPRGNKEWKGTTMGWIAQTKVQVRDVEGQEDSRVTLERSLQDSRGAMECSHGRSSACGGRKI